MKYKSSKGATPKGHAVGPTQRQLRAGELVRHALVAVLREHEVSDPALKGVSVTVTEVRLSPDLRHALCFIEPLGSGLVGVEGAAPTGHGQDVVDGLNRAAKFLRGRMGRLVELKFTPDLKFLHDESFEEAARLNRLFASPDVRRDLDPPEHELEGDEDDGRAEGGEA
jgi:ribosome-binding factor A